MKKKLISLAGGVALALLTASCSVLPSAGPYSHSFAEKAYDHVKTTTAPADASEAPMDYVLVDVDRKIVNIMARKPNKPFDGRFRGDRNPADIRIGIGDTVRVTIFEAGSGGLFVPTGVTLSNGNFVNVPDQAVDRSGTIKVPYAGRVRVVGRRPSEVQRVVEEKLKNRAIEPQVVVTLPERKSNLITVLGDVNESGRFNVTLGGDRVLDAIGYAKGAKYQDYETLVTLQRGKRKATVRLSSLTKNPKNDIYLFPRDVIYVKRNQRFFKILGAAGLNGEIAFDRENLTLADALSKGGGLLDERADPHTVVLYRREPRKTLQEMGARTPEQYDNLVPTVYRLNLREPGGFFLAQHFDVRNNDLIYVSNAPIVEWLKVLSVINAHTATVISGRGALNAVEATQP